MDLEQGAVVDGRYEVDAIVGHGGQATVYRVRHRVLGTWHALKVVHTASPAHRERVLREGRAQAGLAHPNIVRVTDVVTVGEAPALVLDFVDGEDLGRRLDRGRLTLEEADAIALDVLSAVSAAHAAGIVHRDLKPENILLSDTPDGVVPKVTDFGLAMVLDAADRRTPSHAWMGTPSYMAPEQIRSSRDVDHRADVWALGAVLYELVTGVRAFEGEDIFAVFTAVGRGRYVPVQKLAPDAPARMVAAIDGALTPDVDRRIGSCDALAAVWRGATRPPRRWALGPRWAVGAAIAVVGGALLWFGLARRPAAPALPEVRPVEVVGPADLADPPARLALAAAPVPDAVPAAAVAVAALPVAPPAPEVRMARFEDRGADVELRRGSDVWRAGDPVPPGEYELWVDPPTGSPPYRYPAPVTVLEGQHLRVSCSVASELCRIEEVP